MVQKLEWTTLPQTSVDTALLFWASLCSPLSVCMCVYFPVLPSYGNEHDLLACQWFLSLVFRLPTVTKFFFVTFYHDALAAHLWDDGTIWASLLVKCCLMIDCKKPESVDSCEKPVVGTGEIVGKFEDMSLIPRKLSVADTENPRTGEVNLRLIGQ